MNPVKRLGFLLDTFGGRGKMNRFRQGWPSQTSPEIKFFKTKTVQYRYRERPCAQGRGPTIVFTADPPVTLEVYDELVAVFARRFRVIIVEMPAMGFSAARSDYTFGFRETNDDLALFLRAVAGEKAIWAFSCVAGLAAVDLAVRCPELASRLVLLQTGDVDAFAKWKAGRDPKGVLVKPVIGQYVMKKVAPKTIPAWYHLAVGNRAKIDHFCNCADQSLSHGALFSLASAYQAYMDPAINLGSPPQPILAIWGLADRSHPKGNEVSALSFSDNVTIKTLPDLGHFAELEDPEKLFKIISEFIDG